MPGHRPCLSYAIHSERLIGDIFGSMHCDCRAQLVESLKLKLRCSDISSLGGQGYWTL